MNVLLQVVPEFLQVSIDRDIPVRVGDVKGFSKPGGADFNTITRVLKNKEWDKVPDALYLYRNPGSNVEAGLARRRKAEGEAWKKG